MRAKYVVESENDEILVIRDVGKAQMTVTNDAEAVVEDLEEKGLLRGRKLLYYDSEGRLDELKHKDGKFSGFAPGPRP